MTNMTTETEYPRGKELLRQAVNQIIEHPETWDQQQWHCGTKHCVGGWIQIRGGLPENERAVLQDVAKLVGMTGVETDWLCSSNRTIYEIYSFAKDFLNDTLYDRDGYSRDGYNRDGYDRAGYDRAGYDRAGYDRDGKQLERTLL